MKRLKSIISFILLFSIIFVSISYASENDEAKKLYKKANEAMSEKRKSDAADIYKEIIEKYPDSQYAISGIQNIQYYYNKFGKKWLGTTYFKSVITRKDVPESLRAQARMAIAYLKQMHLYSSTQGTYKPKDMVSVNVNGRNIEEMDISVYKVDRDYIIKNITGLRNILNLSDLKKKVVQSFKDKIEKKNNNDYFHKNIEFVLQEPGIYIFEAATEYLITKTAIVVTDNILLVKSDQKNTLLWLADRITGKPVSDAKVIVPFQNDIKEGVTDEDGIVNIPLDLKTYSSAIITAIKGDDIAVSDAYFYRNYQPAMMYFYTDRPIYRPSHKVQFKGILREISDDDYLLPKSAKADVIIRDPRWKEVKKSSIDLTEFGTFSGEYDIPDEPALGRYSVQVTFGSYSYYGYFTVEEYKKPEYFVTITPEKEAYIMGDRIKVSTMSEYYFGAPVIDAEITWKVYEREYYYPWWLDFRYHWYLSSQKADYRYGYYGRGKIASSGSLNTDKEGLADFEFDTKINNYDSTYTLVVKVTDKSRKVVESEKSVMVTKGEFRIDLRTNKYSYKEDEDVFVKVTSKDYTGRAVSKKIDVEVTRYVRTDNGKNNVKELFLTKTIETDEEGTAGFDFKVDKVGQYQIVLTSIDSRGTKIIGSKNVYVYNYNYSWYEDTGKGVNISADREMYKPGDTANLTISTNHADSYALVTVEQRRLYEYRIIKITNNSVVIPVELKDSYEPNMTVTASIVNSNNLLSEHKQIIVIPEDKFLTIDIIPDKAKYKPGEIASFTVKTTDYKGEPVPAEISFALVDESIYALMSEQSLNIQQFFYGLQQNWVQTRTSFNFYFWGQTGGVMREEKAGFSADMAMEAEGVPASAPMEKDAFVNKSRAAGDSNGDIAFLEAKVREKFKDTAFYRAHIMTDDSGTAGFEVELPDNLTTWRASVKGVTMDTIVGQESKKILVTKDLLVRLELPRFFTKRDKGTVTGIVHNYLDEPKKVKVILDIAKNSPAPIKVEGESELILEIGANEEKRIDWPVDVVRSGEAQITIKALTDEESDAMKLTLPIMPHGVMKHTGDAGVVGNEKRISFTIPENSLNESAKLRLIFSPTVANIVTESLEYLIGYPYGCVEQTMSRFLPNIMVSRTLQNLGLEVSRKMEELPDMVKKGLERLYGFQHPDGGWGWWEADDTNPFMTAYVVYGLSEAVKTDFSVSPKVLRNGINSLKSQIKESEDINTTVFMLYALKSATNAEKIEKSHLDRIYDEIDELNNYSLALFAETLRLSGETEKAKEAIGMLLQNSEDAGGMIFFKSKVRKGHGWYDSDTEATAYALKAIVKTDPENEAISKIVLWLANSRVGIRWYNTKDTAAAVMALSEYLAVSDEMEPDYNFSVKINSKDAGDYFVNKDNMFSFDGDMEIDNALLTAGENSVEITKNGDGKLYYSVFLKYYSDEENIDDSSSGINVKKTILKKVDDKWSEFDGELKVGEEIKVMLEVNGSKGYEYVIIEDPKPAGCDEVIRSYEKSGAKRNYWWSNIDYRDEKMAVFITRMWQGQYKFEYELTAQTPGLFHVMPAKAYMMYRDEIGGNSDEFKIKVIDK